LRGAYPAGDGSAVIFRSMPVNSRRVRWLSASSNHFGAVDVAGAQLGRQTVTLAIEQQ